MAQEFAGSGVQWLKSLLVQWFSESGVRWFSGAGSVVQ